MKTLMASFNPETTLLIRGIKAKIDVAGRIIAKELERSLADLIPALKALITH